MARTSAPYPAVITLGSNLVDHRFVILDLAALDPAVILKLPGGRGKGVAQSHVDILVGLFVMVVTAHHDLLVGYADIQPDLVEIALMLVVMLGLDRNPAADDVMAVLLKLVGFFPNSSFHRIGMRDAPESDLKW